MNDMSNLNRENKKSQLRRQIITADGQQTSPEPNGGNDSEAVIRKARAKVRRRRFKLLAVALVVLGGLAFATYQYLARYQYTSYQVKWQRPIKEGSFAGFLNFGSNVIKYTKDGATYIDASGKDAWSYSYQMKSPIAYAKGDFAVIADQQGNSLYIFNKAGNTGSATTVLPITKATCSAQGVAAVIMEDATGASVNFFRNDGSLIDLDMKFLLASEAGGGKGADGKEAEDAQGVTGYPMDISLSPDGTEMIGAYEYLKNGAINGRVAFHNFSEVGQNVPTRMVGGFDTDYFPSDLVARVHFMTNTYSCAFADDSITFFSTRNLLSPSVIKQVKVKERIESVLYSDQYAGVVVDNPKGPDPYRLDIYRTNGSLVFSKAFDFPYKRAEIDGDYVFLYNEDSCQAYNMSGRLKFSSKFDFAIAKVRKGRYPNTLILTGPQEMKEIKMK